jgi:midasin (ATPase involved in ribosome maturation)
VRRGAWVLLDELNLAGQTVLEGLNAVLDHRAEVGWQGRGLAAQGLRRC